MLLDEEGYIKIFDFGLSKKASHTGSAYTQNVIGTPGHMAPELFDPINSGGYAFSGSVDVFAFGALLLRSILGKIPPELVTFPPAKIKAPAYFDQIGVTLPPEIAQKLNNCLEGDPGARPKMHELSYLLEREILKDRHKIMVCTSSKTYNIDANNRSIILNATGKGTFALNYDGYEIIISKVSGIVNVNNMQISDGQVIPKSCVVVLGAPRAVSGHSNVTVDASHPGVNL